MNQKSKPDQKKNTLPMEGLHSDADGHYQLVVKLSDSVIKPGDPLTIELFITGYGAIDCAKTTFHPSSNAFQLGECKVYSSTKLTDSGLEHGIHIQDVSDVGGTMFLDGGIQTEFWDRPYFFFDQGGERSRSISTEHRYLMAPITFKMKTKKNISPGSYELTFSLTYFNGFEWKGSNVTSAFNVSNLLQRYEYVIGALGIFSVVLGFIAVVFQVLDFFCK